ncbi:hypothetical protein RHSIM_RhsimUnG0016000 [Rhododendron simsii]|uniref:Uncharacterized protein n=1 Tax=Rhododendron simsii TaxID=118357 RepID=A0A834FX33_RHOSS|nr:hypothetical protein RHSIM_RhsimUnG0016000 [Rhododendron simsii]
MSLMIIKHSISETIRGAMPEEENAKKFLSQNADQFVAVEKVEACSKLVTMQYNGEGNIREYIMEMSNIVAKMKALKLEFSEDILMFLVLISLPTQFGPFRINYNTQREKWTLNELIAQLQDADANHQTIPELSPSNTEETPTNSFESAKGSELLIAN